jgi:hypothetical protein
LSVAANFVVGVDALTSAALKECGTCARSESTSNNLDFSIPDGLTGGQIDGGWEVGVRGALLDRFQRSRENLLAAPVGFVLLVCRLAANAVSISAAWAGNVNGLDSINDTTLMRARIVHGTGIAASQCAILIVAYSKVVVLQCILGGEFGTKAASLPSRTSDGSRRLEGARAVVPLVTNGRAGFITAPIGGVLDRPGAAAALDSWVDAHTSSSGC